MRDTLHHYFDVTTVAVFSIVAAWILIPIAESVMP